MCGIVGVIGTRPAAPILMEALRRLEYRGYDSSGIATLPNGHIDRRRAQGKLCNLAASLDRRPMQGTIGIGHTRWATHGAPTESNAHPHGTVRVSIVHNGIIENYAELRLWLLANGYDEEDFTSETDTEVAALVIDYYLSRHGMTPIEASLQAFKRFEGAYALEILFAGFDFIICKQHGAPLAIGYGRGEMFVGSDALALAPHTDRVTYLMEGDWALVERNGVMISDAQGNSVEREVKISRHTADTASKGKFRHYMEKELHEHPKVIGDTLRSLIDPNSRTVSLPGMEIDLSQVSRITMTACGSSFYAGLVGRWWIEKYARIPTDADVASEFRYRTPPLSKGGLGLLISQSGETADTMAALRYMRDEKQHILSVVNVSESTMTRESDGVLETVAGPEVGVASTKATTAQMTALACLTIKAGRDRGTIDLATEATMLNMLHQVPSQVTRILTQEERIIEIAKSVQMAKDVLFLGRGGMFPIAMEGALKLKEISYIHAEGYAAGEMKHGPIALIDPTVPIIGLCPSGPLFEKTASNLQEAAARGGQIIVFTDQAGALKLKSISAEIFIMPDCSEFVAPILYVVPVQMLAYQVAVLKGTDVDQPRNLAKSVTVE